jgi:putative redox protein
MNDIDVWHCGNDRFLIRVGDHDLLVDQPREEGGDDMGPTPTELFLSGLASCVAFYAERFLRRHNLPVAGLHVMARGLMSEDWPARVASVNLQVHVPDDLPVNRREALRAVIEHCTVHNSLRRPPEVTIELEVAREAA